MGHKFLRGMGLLLGCAALAGGMNVMAAPSDDIWKYTTSKEDGLIVYEFEDVNLKLPQNWESKFEVKEEDGQIGFYHKASLEAGSKEGDESCGALFWLNFSEDYSFTNNAPYYLVGSGENGIYYITVPGDLHGYNKDESILNEWMEMSKDVEKIQNETASANSGAPMLTTTGVNLRSENNPNSKILDVIPSDTAVWVTGNPESAWMKADYDGNNGYVSADYLEFPTNVGSFLAKDNDDEEDSEPVSKPGNSASDSDSNSETDIPQQGFLSAVLYDANGNSVTVKQADDGYWYDENGVRYGHWKDIQEGTPITNENGDVYYWTVQEPDNTDDPDETPSEPSDISDPYDLYSWDAETGNYIPFQQADGDGSPVGKGNGWYYYDQSKGEYLPW